MKTSDGLSYRIQKGSEKPIIFIHGWLGSKNFWELIKPFLDIKNTLVFYDQRCHGNSKCSDFDIDVLADDLDNLIQELDLEDPIIVGHSMGGMTALKYASKYGNLSGLFLLGTSASTPEPENKSVKYFLEKFDELDRDEWAEKITQNYVGQSENEEIKEITREELNQAEEKPIKYGLKTMIDYDVQSQLEELEIPSLVIAAEKDRAITIEKSKELAKLLECNIKTVDTTHQMLPEKPERIANLISDFVNSET
jgi:pimeloyl-ACP methyl ester carboxylesterase